MMSVVLSRLKWGEIKSSHVEVAVLPWGATEAHNVHLPYGTDTFESEYFAVEAARISTKPGKEIVVLPAMPFGVNTAQMKVPLNISINPSTQLSVVKDIVYSLEVQKIRKLIIVNSHGGNSFAPIIRELYPLTSLFICLLNTYQCVKNEIYFDEPGDHAGEMETSLMLHINPDLVGPIKSAGSGEIKKFKIDSLNEGWAWSQRDWMKVAKDNGAGNPANASAEKGAQFASAVISKMAKLFTEVANADLDDLYK